MARWLAKLAVGALAVQRAYAALPAIDWEDNESIKAAAKLVAEDLLSFYPTTPGWTVGILPGPPPNGDYYWWQGGAMWGTLLDYRHYTGDKDYDDLITAAMVHQAGDNRDYNPTNWSASMGNDDQAFWGMSAMIAAETGYTNPAADEPQWLSLVQAVFNEQTLPERRADVNGPCKGGLRWQVYQVNTGWDYINTISNACYMNMGARLGLYLANDTYLKAAEGAYDLIKGLKYISDDYDVFDGGHLPDCSDTDALTYSYNAGVLLQSVAVMYKATNGSEKWTAELDGLLNRTISNFFRDDGIAYERNCEQVNSCNTDMITYKGFLHRWMSYTMIVAPYTRDIIAPVLRSSAKAAVKQCTGGDNGRMCGFHWSSGQFDGIVGAGQQMDVLAALISTMNVANVEAPLTNTTGGTSTGDFNAGSDQTQPIVWAPITAGDKAGAAILTAIFVGASLGTMAWMSIG